MASKMDRRRPPGSLIALMTIAVPIVGMVLIGVLTLTGCGQTPAETPAQTPRPVRAIIVQPQAATSDWILAGDVRPRIQVNYGFRIGGRLLERKVQVGDAVVAGQLLARLDPRDLTPALASQRAQEEAARTDLTLATADLKRAEALRRDRFVSDANVDRQRATVKAAQARLDAAVAQVRQASNALDFQHLRADTAGVVIAVDAEAGQVLAVGQTAIRVAQHGDFEVAVSIPEQDLERARRNQDWTVTLSGLPGRHWSARVRELAPAADPASRTFAARLTLLGDTSAVAYGMSATVRAGDAGPLQLRIPRSALFSRDGEPRVWLVEGDGTVRSQPITLGGLGGEDVIVRDGLAVGARVVTAGANLLREDQPVRLIAQP